MDILWMVLGFSFAAYAIVANDSIQTLGTFLSSNEKRPWWILWAFISGILVVTVTLGWLENGGDPAFGRLAAEGKNVPHPSDFGGQMTWLFILPPLLLIIFTQMGIPVSTSLLVLTAYKGLVSFQQGKDSKSALDLFKGMMEKSLVGYGIAFLLGLVIFILVLHLIEKRVAAEGEDREPHIGWSVFQWFSTGFLWSMWLIQDLANIFCYLPRKLEAPGFFLAIGGMVLLQGYLIKNKGGKIQQIVKRKTNTLDVRSATCIDFLYGVVLLVFKLGILSGLGIDTKLPMSTTWVFLGLLAGREIGIAYRLQNRGTFSLEGILLPGVGLGAAIASFLVFFKVEAFSAPVFTFMVLVSLGILVFFTLKVNKDCGNDVLKALSGSVISALLALILPFLAQTFTPLEDPATSPSEEAPAVEEKE